MDVRMIESCLSARVHAEGAAHDSPGNVLR